MLVSMVAICFYQKPVEEIFFLIYTESYSEVIPIARANIKGHLKEEKNKQNKKKTIITIIATKQINKLTL